MEFANFLPDSPGPIIFEWLSSADAMTGSWLAVSARTIRRHRNKRGSVTFALEAKGCTLQIVRKTQRTAAEYPPHME